ncbi:hypothetical protein COEREDRAFT_82849 [Coemansia reversa NRRL 1564]|uniref:Uncharacterized protein n=1 Tax=Coemansia reversa (strain ATCC 12441 / NRRL 1564) TaxID=763665 RepID=A0A2G5B5P5_COERN|nr:hypothetical protein COEREDRAFT_82849 [Coemansia reversa NRRL 1564]|eukprot:PIA14335.1 hypothetical protein COEREDRAFT_82849 [Coemansia reversa NRRL 1564]
MNRQYGEREIHGNSRESEPAEATTNQWQVLYEDKYLKVTEEALIVKLYYFPTLGSRTIYWEEIEWVKIASEANVGWLELKMWGMGFGSIWWNCKARLLNIGNSRNDGRLVNRLSDILATNIVIKVKGACIRPGSFVEHPDAAMAAIGQLIYRNHPHTE